MPNVTVALTANMVTQLGMANVKGYAVYFNANGTAPTWAALDSTNWTPTPTGGGATVTLRPGFEKGLKVYFILQSTDQAGDSVQTQITTESQIVPTGTTTSAQTLNYRYDSFEVTFTPAAADAGNLTDINGFGIPMAIEVEYGTAAQISAGSPTSSASRGYNLSGGTVSGGGIWEALASAGGSGSIQYFTSVGSGGYATTQPRMAISPATAIGEGIAGTNYSVANWNPYISAVASSGAATSGSANQIQLAGYFNGAPDANGIWHNAGFYAYNVTYSGTNFILTPGTTSQIKGTITIGAADLANSIYMTLGNATISGLSTGDGTGGTTTLTMNTGANNEWGTVLRDFLAGFTAGYWDGAATSLNPNVSGSIVLNKEWYQDPTYAFGGAVSSGSGSVTHSGTVAYDEYAKVFFNSTNSYGNGYSDFLTRAYDVGPLINVSDGTGTPTDSSHITVTLFADNDTTSGYTTPVIHNYVPASSGGYLVPSGYSSSGIQTQLDFNVGTMSLAPGTPVTIVLKGATSAADVALPTISAFGNYSLVSGSGGSGYVMSNTGGTVVTGIINIHDLPVTAASSGTGVNWYQIVVGAGAAQKTFNLYETVDSAGRILNPAYAGQGGVIAIDGLATVAGNGSGQFIADTSGQVGINFQNGGTNSLDPSLMAAVPLSAASLPNAAYPAPMAPLVGMRPGYLAGLGGQFLESYQVWTVQTPSISGNLPTTTPQTVYNGGLVFGWNGADSAAVQQRAAINSSFVSAYTNKIGGGSVAKLTFTGPALPSEIVSNGGYLVATADADGNWATAAPVSFGNGSYTVEMQEFATLANAQGNVSALNSASIVQSFTVSQGAVISNYNLSVDSGQTSAGLTLVSSGASSGRVTVNSGGTASATMISAGGIMYMAAGSGDTGSIVLGEHQVWAGATASNTTVARGGYDSVYGTTSAASVNGGGTQVIGGAGAATNAIASGTTLNSGSHQHVKSAGSAVNTTVLSGGIQAIDSAGLALNTSVYSGGLLHVSSGGLASGGTVAGGTVDIFASGVTSNLLLQGGGGLVNVSSGGITSFTTLQSGNTINVFSGGSAAHATVQNGANLNVYAGGFSMFATVQSGGVEDVIGSGAIATNATVQIGGYEWVNSGASAVSANLQFGGQQWVWGADASATSTTIGNGARQHVYAGAHAEGTTVQSGGALWAWNSGTVVSSTTIQSGGTMVVHGGGFATDVALNGGTVDMNIGGAGSVTINSSGSIVKVYDGAGAVSISGLTPTAGTIDFVDVAYTTGTVASWTSTGVNTGTLALFTSGQLEASVQLFGSYHASSFNLASDGAHGTFVTDPAVGNDSQNLLALPHG